MPRSYWLIGAELASTAATLPPTKGACVLHAPCAMRSLARPNLSVELRSPADDVVSSVYVVFVFDLRVFSSLIMSGMFFLLLYSYHYDYLISG
jgi:hypothetical protein